MRAGPGAGVSVFRWAAFYPTGPCVRGDRRESNPHSGSHRPVRFPYATTTVSCCSCPPGRNRTVVCRLSGGCTSLVLRAEGTRWRAGDSNPQTHVVGHPLSRRAPGTCAGRTLQDQSGRWGSNPRLHGPEPCALPLRYTPRGGRRGSRTLKAHRSSVFETVAITRWLALP
jgi:hypothetical protein